MDFFGIARRSKARGFSVENAVEQHSLSLYFEISCLMFFVLAILGLDGWLPLKNLNLPRFAVVDSGASFATCSSSVLINCSSCSLFGTRCSLLPFCQNLYFIFIIFARVHKAWCCRKWWEVVSRYVKKHTKTSIHAGQHLLSQSLCRFNHVQARCFLRSRSACTTRESDWVSLSSDRKWQKKVSQHPDLLSLTELQAITDVRSSLSGQRESIATWPPGGTVFYQN